MSGPPFQSSHTQRRFATWRRSGPPLELARNRQPCTCNLGGHARSRGAAYAALDFRALRRFSLSVSAREEVYRNFSGEFSPTVAGGVWLSERVKLRASASRGFRVPSYTDLYYHDPANVGSPNLRPEREWTYEGGLDWNPGGRVHGPSPSSSAANAMGSTMSALHRPISGAP